MFGGCLSSGAKTAPSELLRRPRGEPVFPPIREVGSAPVDDEIRSVMSKHDAKIVILGASGVGKTCIGLRFVKDPFHGGKSCVQAAM